MTNAPGGALWPLANMTPSLYNLQDDPREISDVAAQHPDIVSELLALLAHYGGGVAVPVVENATVDPASNPRHWNSSWTPWRGI